MIFAGSLLEDKWTREREWSGVVADGIGCIYRCYRVQWFSLWELVGADEREASGALSARSWGMIRGERGLLVFDCSRM